jgi:hypothetical protein
MGSQRVGPYHQVLHATFGEELQQVARVVEEGWFSCHRHCSG